MIRFDDAKVLVAVVPQQRKSMMGRHRGIVMYLEGVFRPVHGDEDRFFIGSGNALGRLLCLPK